MKVLVTGGAGFIGSHLCDRLLAEGATVHALDDLSLGRKENIAHNLDRSEFRFIEADVLEADRLCEIFRAESYDRVFHFAANSDIALGNRETDHDLRLTFLATYNVLECARRFGVGEIVFPSSSTVFGSHAGRLAEDSGPLRPASLYGAAKLASEAFLSAYSSLFGIRAWIFRLPNVVGGRMTHGCIFDFIEKLRADPSRLVVLGDGSQSKPYVLVEEVLNALFLAMRRPGGRINCYHIGVESTTSVRRIAEIVLEEMGLTDTKIEFSGGEAGWPGDVPRFRYDLRKIHALGWKARHTSDEAVRIAVRRLLGLEGAPNSNAGGDRR